MPKHESSVSFAGTIQYFVAFRVLYSTKIASKADAEMIDLLAPVSGSANIEEKVGGASDELSEEIREICT